MVPVLPVLLLHARRLLIEHTFQKDNRRQRGRRSAQRPGSLGSVHDGTRAAGPAASPARGAEVLAMEAGCEDYCERELDLVELEGDRVYLHLGIRRDEPPRS